MGFHQPRNIRSSRLTYQLDHSQQDDILDYPIPMPRGGDKGGWLRLRREEERGEARGKDQQGRSLRKRKGLQLN